jgi:hypothetical protein
MAEKPLLFLDVDGVINVPGADDEGEYVQTGNGFPAWIPYGTKERVHGLMKHFDIVWATAWFGAAHGAFKEVLDLPEESWPYIAWTNLKLPWIIKYAGDRPWAWADDDIQFELDDMGWDRDRMLPSNTLLQDIDEKVGLSDSDVHELIYWAKTGK